MPPRGTFGVGVDHGGAHILVAEQFLDGTDVAAILEEVRGKRMAEGVTTDAFLDARFSGGFLDGALQNGGVEVMAAFFSSAWAERAFGDRKEILPGRGGTGAGRPPPNEIITLLAFQN